MPLTAATADTAAAWNSQEQFRWAFVASWTAASLVSVLL